MTSAGPWSVKGIDPKAREIAKDLARRSGMTLGDWLNQMIIEGGEAEPTAPPPPPRRGLEELYREAQARRSALTTAPVDTDASRMARALDSLSSRVEAGEHRATLAISGIDQSMLGVLSRLDELDREHVATGARLSGLLNEVRTAQTAIADRLRRGPDDSAQTAALHALQDGLARLAERMDEASAKAEAEAQAASEAVARRLDRVETVMEAAPAAFADAEKVETVLTRMAERLDQNDTRTDAAMQSLQASFASLDARLRSNEARTAHVGGQDLERRFQSLAQELTQRIDATRAELSQRLRSAADGRLEGVQANLRELGGQMDAAEKRSAQAIDRIGREVMRVAHSLGERVGAVERTGAELGGRTDAHMAEIEARAETRLADMEARSAAAAEAAAGEMSRVADAMEARLRDADNAQAQALEKLGGEIERIAERLAERIATADRRQAEAMDEVTDKVAKIGVRIDARQDQVSGELADRIRASETRTAELLEEARTRLGRPTADGGHDLAPAPEPVHAAAPPPPLPFEPEFDVFEPAHEPPAAVQPETSQPQAAHLEAEIDGLHEAHAADTFPSNADPFAFPEPAEAHAPAVDWMAESDPFAGRGGGSASPFNPDDDFMPSAEATAAEPVFAPALFDEPGAPHAPQYAPHAAGREPEVESEPFEPAFAGFSVSDFAPAPAEAEPAPEPRPEQLSTRQMLDAARQAARRAALGKGGETAAPDGSVVVPPREAKQAPRPFGITFPSRRKKESAPTLRTFVLASGIAGSLTAMGVGAYLMGGAGHDGAPALSSEVAANGALGDGAAALAPSAAPTVTPTAAVALAPSPASTQGKIAAPSATLAPAAASKAGRIEAAPARTAAPAVAKAATPSQLYATAVGRLENGDLSGLADLRAAADRGLPKAQFYLARLYDQGGSGVAKDPAEARRWTERAAQGGDPSAMYNLASYFYGGDGGARDPAKAADWFRKAAEHGVVNGQYNLAQLYEKGYGVPQSDAEAYKWYLVAAGSGDNESRLAAAALKSKLSPAAQTAAQNGAASLRAGLDDGMRTADAAPPSS